MTERGLSLSCSTLPSHCSTLPSHCSISPLHCSIILHIAFTSHRLYFASPLLRIAFTSHRFFLTIPLPAMTSQEALTISELIQLIKEKRDCFDEHHVPLSQTQVDAVERFLAWIAVDRKAIRRNPAKKKSHLILSDLWTHIPEVFILCALVTFPTKLASLNPTDCYRELFAWWESANHPKGLKWIIEHHGFICQPHREVAAIERKKSQKRHMPADDKGKDNYSILLNACEIEK